MYISNNRKFNTVGNPEKDILGKEKDQKLSKLNIMTCLGKASLYSVRVEHVEWGQGSWQKSRKDHWSMCHSMSHYRL